MTANDNFGLEESAVDIKKKLKKWQKISLIVAAPVFAAALGVAAFLLMGDKNSISEDRIERIIDYGTVLEGISVGGVDVSRRTGLEASEATKNLSGELLSTAQFTLDIDGETVIYTAQDFELYTDYDEVFAEAMRYGHVGTFEERQQAQITAASEGINFEIEMYANETKVEAVIAALKAEKDTPVADAGFVFMPWGYFEDGSEYKPDMDEMVTVLSKKQEYVYTEGLVTIPLEEMPSELRYEYFQDDYDWEDHYDKQYTPKDASIARFLYNGETKGVNIDKTGTVDLIMQAVQNDDFGVISVPAEITHSETKLEDLKAQTMLIASWTSSYHDHYSRNRTYNVGKMSYIISGVVIQPGETWSINAEAGERNAKNGWKEAAGITDGAFTEQYGGGVCQISSTLYNAALRAGLSPKEDIDHSNHSIISDYIPIGLDATISSKGPDIKLTNRYDTPLYIVSYLNGVEENVTIEIYGALPVHEQYGPVIYDYSSKKSSTGETPGYTYIYNASQTPEGVVIPYGGQVEYVRARPKTEAKVYMHILDLTGKELEKVYLYTATYKAYTGMIYVNGPDPAAATPTPTTGP